MRDRLSLWFNEIAVVYLQCPTSLLDVSLMWVINMSTLPGVSPEWCRAENSYFCSMRMRFYAFTSFNILAAFIDGSSILSGIWESDANSSGLFIGDAQTKINSRKTRNLNMSYGYETYTMNMRRATHKQQATPNKL